MNCLSHGWDRETGLVLSLQKLQAIGTFRGLQPGLTGYKPVHLLLQGVVDPFETTYLGRFHIKLLKDLPYLDRRFLLCPSRILLALDQIVFIQQNEGTPFSKVFLRDRKDPIYLNQDDHRAILNRFESNRFDFERAQKD